MRQFRSQFFKSDFPDNPTGKTTFKTRPDKPWTAITHFPNSSVHEIRKKWSDLARFKF